MLVLRPSSTVALRSQWIGPSVVKEVGVANAYWVRFPDGGRKSVHASQLKLYVARGDQVGVICDKFELVHLLNVQRPFIASWEGEELADNLYEKRANQVVTFVVRKDRVGIGSNTIAKYVQCIPHRIT